jgi:hypothetical protein
MLARLQVRRRRIHRVARHRGVARCAPPPPSIRLPACQLAGPAGSPSPRAWTAALVRQGLQSRQAGRQTDMGAILLSMPCGFDLHPLESASTVGPLGQELQHRCPACTSRTLRQVVVAGGLQCALAACCNSRIGWACVTLGIMALSARISAKRRWCLTWSQAAIADRDAWKQQCTELLAEKHRAEEAAGRQSKARHTPGSPRTLAALLAVMLPGILRCGLSVCKAAQDGFCLLLLRRRS